jgi:hypothetical protein
MDGDAKQKKLHKLEQRPSIFSYQQLRTPQFGDNEWWILNLSCLLTITLLSGWQVTGKVAISLNLESTEEVRFEFSFFGFAAAKFKDSFFLTYRDFGSPYSFASLTFLGWPCTFLFLHGLKKCSTKVQCIRSLHHHRLGQQLSSPSHLDLSIFRSPLLSSSGYVYTVL